MNLIAILSISRLKAVVGMWRSICDDYGNRDNLNDTKKVDTFISMIDILFSEVEKAAGELETKLDEE